MLNTGYRRMLKARIIIVGPGCREASWIGKAEGLENRNNR